MESVLEKLQNLGKSRLTRLGAEAFLLVMAFLMLIWPHLLRDSSLLLAGREPYYHLKNGILHYLVLFLNNYLNIGELFLAKLIPLMLGLVCVVLFYSSLRKMRLSYPVILIATLILIFSPNFIYLFGTFNSYAFIAILFLISFLLFLKKQKVLAVLPLYLLPFFSTLAVILFLVLVLVYGIKEKNFRMLILSLPIVLIIYVFGTTTVPPDFGSSFISDFGGYYGLGMFVVLLSLFGLKYLWRRKYKHLQIYSAMILIYMAALLDIRMLSILNFILVVLAALGLIDIIKKERRSQLIKQLTVLIMICGLIFSGVAYVNFLSSDLPDEEVLDIMGFLSSLPDGRVLSDINKKPWIEYSGKKFVDDRNLFHVKSVGKALHTIRIKKIRYFWISDDMVEKIWQDEEKELLYLLENSKHFKKKKITERNIIWEFDKKDDISS